MSSTVSAGRNTSVRGNRGPIAPASSQATTKLPRVRVSDCSRIMRTITQFGAPISFSVAIERIFSIVST